MVKALTINQIRDLTSFPTQMPCFLDAGCFSEENSRSRVSLQNHSDRTLILTTLTVPQ